MRLSVATIVRDAAATLPRMLASARGVADEFVLVDTGSQDDTVRLARRLGARTLEVAWGDDFAAARNVALEAARGDWILVLDADDRLLPQGSSAIRRAITWPARYQLERPSLLTGFCFGMREEHLDGTPLRTVASSGRLFRRARHLRYYGRVHEEVLYQGVRARTRWALLPGVHIAHTGSDPSLLAAKLARNERLLLLELADRPRNAVAMYYLACQYQQQRQDALAAAWAGRALAAGVAYGELKPELVAEMAALSVA